jgi:hypothetical protein
MFLLCSFFVQFTPCTDASLTVSAAVGYYQERKWVIPNKEMVTIRGESRANTIINVGLPLDDSFINCDLGVRLVSVCF